MQIGINDLDDDDFGMGFEPSQEPQQEPTYQEPQESARDDDYLSDYLRSRGIDDASKIKFENEDGTILVKFSYPDETISFLREKLESKGYESNLKQLTKPDKLFSIVILPNTFPNSLMAEIVCEVL